MNHVQPDWDDVTVEDFGEVVAGGTPSRAVPSFWNGQIPWVTPGEITSLQGKYVRDTKERITPEGLAGSAAKLLPVGSLLVTTRATLGEVAIAAVPVATNQGFKSIIPNGETDSLFAFYCIGTLKREMVRLASGTTFLEISKVDFSHIRTRRPRRPEQSRIAAVLDTADEAIAKTEAVIAKLKQVRAGLLHDLLSRGLDEHGQLRDPISHPEQFKDSPLGRIPMAWDCLTLEESCDWFSGGTPDRSNVSWWRGRTPLLTPKDMKAFELSDTSEHVTEEAVQAGSRLMPSETVFIVVRGMILAHTFPVCLCTRPFAFNQDIKAVRACGKLTNRFLAHWFAANAALFLRKATEATHGTKKLDTDELYRVRIGVPSKEEQSAILERIDILGADINAEAATHSKLSQLKSGLMADLLTGRVRVPEGVGV